MARWKAGNEMSSMMHDAFHEMHGFVSLAGELIVVLSLDGYFHLFKVE